jgi:endonuclease G
MHDDRAKIASWVVYTLTSANSIGCLPRTGRFAPDDRLTTGRRAELVDYAGSGYDTGHIANSADMSWNPVVAKESFFLSNAAPQLPALNRGAWRQLETTVRTWAYMTGEQGSVTIYAGSIYDGWTSNRIGPNRVVVPSHFYKIIINNVTKQSLAFVFPHEDVSDFRLSQTTVAHVEALTNIRFDIPDDRNARHQRWNADYRMFLSASRRKCSRIPG